MSTKIRIILFKKDMTMTTLAKKLGTSLTALSNKLRHGNLSERDLAKFADALDCDYEAYFIMRDTGEKI